MQFEINGILWTLKFVEPMDSVLWTGSRYTLGVTVLPERTIYINAYLNKEKLRDVLSHEICHSMVASYGYDMPISEEECFCQIMERRGDEVRWLADEILKNF